MDRILGQISERRIAGAKVVQRPFQTCRHQAAEGALGDLHAGEQQALGDFQFQPRQRVAALGHGGEQFAGEIVVGQLSAGDIDRQPPRFDAFFTPFLPLPTSHGDDLATEEDNQVRLFRHGYEIPGLNQFSARMPPAQQCLETDNTAGLNIDLGLVVEFEFVIVEPAPQLTLHRQPIVGAR